MLARDSPGPVARTDDTRSVTANVLRQARWPSSTRLVLLSAVTICVVVSLGSISLRSRRYSPFSASLRESANEDHLDQRLSHAATAALGDGVEVRFD